MSAYNSRRMYRGDPGLLGFLGKVGGSIAKSLPGVGAIVSAAEGVGSLLKGRRSSSRPSPAINVASVSAIPPILRGVGGLLGRGAGAAAAGYGVGTAAQKLFGGSGRKRYRRMNATNPKALRRAVRRVQAFGDFARACGYSRPPAKLKGVGFPKKRRKACR